MPAEAGWPLLPNLVTLVTTSGALGFVASRWQRLDAKLFGVILGSGLAYQLGWLGEALAEGLEAKIAWDTAQWGAGILATGAMIPFAAVYAGRPLRGAVRAALTIFAIPAALTVLLALAPRDAYRSGARVDGAGVTSALVYPFTWVDWVLTATVVGAQLYAGAWVLRVLIGSPRGRRLEPAAALTAIVLPSLGMVTVLADARVLGQRDITPLLFGAANLLLLFALARGSLFEAGPRVRSLAWDEYPLGLVVLDERGVLLEINPAGERLLGAPRPVGPGTPIEGLAPALAAALRSTAGDSASGGPIDLPAPGDATLELRVLAVRGGVGGRRLRLLLVRDVTAERRAASVLAARTEGLAREMVSRTAELHESEARFQALFEGAGDAILVLEDGRFVESNEATGEMFRCARGGLLGQTPAEVSPPRQPDGEASESAARQRLAGALAGARQRFAWRHRRADGSEFDAEVTLARVALADRTIVQAIVRDVSERASAEAKRRELEQQLAHAARLESVGRLAGGVAHDFNNVLTTILGNAEVLRDELAGEPERLEFVADIQTAAQSAASLTRQLLAFSRKELIAPRVLDVSDTVRSVHRLLERLLGEDVRLELRCDTAGARVRVDPGQLEQILVNLAVNARDAMPVGGTLRIAVEVVELGAIEAARVGALAPGSHVQLTVTDSGTGMSEAIRSRLFEPFFTTKPAGKGTGLGLATVWGAVRQNGGAIQVESTEGVGTSFRIWLPRIAEAVEAPEQPAPAATSRGDETILLIEDQDEVRAFAERCLRRGGYSVLAFRSGRDALRTLESCDARADAVVTDVVMPDLSGSELARELERVRPGLPVLYVSGYPDETIATHGVLREGLHFLAKPYTPTALLAKLRELLDEPPARADPGERRT